MKKIFITIIIFYSMKVIANNNDVSQCMSEYEKIVRDNSLDSMDKKIIEWKKREKSCCKNGEYEIYYTYLLQRYNKHEEAINFLENEIKNNVCSPKELYLRLGEYYGYVKDFKKSMQVACYLIDNYSLYYGGYVLQGHIHLRNNEINKAHKCYLQAVSTQDGQIASNYLSLVSTYYYLESYDKACECFAKASILDPRITVLSRGNLDDAVKSFIHIGNLTAAKSIIDNQLKFDKGVEEYKGFQEALKMYEDAVKNN